MVNERTANREPEGITNDVVVESAKRQFISKAHPMRERQAVKIASLGFKCQAVAPTESTSFPIYEMFLLLQEPVQSGEDLPVSCMDPTKQV
jgi:hypothetical protein